MSRHLGSIKTRMCIYALSFIAPPLYGAIQTDEYYYWLYTAIVGCISIPAGYFIEQILFDRKYQEDYLSQRNNNMGFSKAKAILASTLFSALLTALATYGFVTYNLGLMGLSAAPAGELGFTFGILVSVKRVA